MVDDYYRVINRGWVSLCKVAHIKYMHSKHTMSIYETIRTRLGSQIQICDDIGARISVNGPLLISFEKWGV